MLKTMHKNYHKLVNNDCIYIISSGLESIFISQSHTTFMQRKTSWYMCTCKLNTDIGQNLPQLIDYSWAISIMIDIICDKSTLNKAKGVSFPLMNSTPTIGQ